MVGLFGPCNNSSVYPAGKSRLHTDRGSKLLALAAVLVARLVGIPAHVVVAVAHRSIQDRLDESAAGGIVRALAAVGLTLVITFLPRLTHNNAPLRVARWNRLCFLFGTKPSAPEIEGIPL